MDNMEPVHCLWYCAETLRLPDHWQEWYMELQEQVGSDIRLEE